MSSRGDTLFKDDKEVGYLTSLAQSPLIQARIALGYVRKEAQEPGTELELRSAWGQIRATVRELPLVKGV